MKKLFKYAIIKTIIKIKIKKIILQIKIKLKKQKDHIIYKYFN